MRKIMFNDKFGLTQAVLEGRKTQTRRTIPMRIVTMLRHSKDMLMSSDRTKEQIDDALSKYGETMSPYKTGDIVAIAQSYKDCGAEAFYWKQTPSWTNKMFVKANLMPHHIKIERVRVERLQDISKEDCLKEGVCQVSEGRYKIDGLNYIGDNPIAVYSLLIEKINGKGTWYKNPFVFAYDFALID